MISYVNISLLLLMANFAFSMDMKEFQNFENWIRYEEFNVMIESLKLADRTKNSIIVDEIMGKRYKFQSLSEDHESILTYAAANGWYNVVEMMIKTARKTQEKGVSLDERTVWQRTLLHTACIHGKDDVAILLIKSVAPAHLKATDVHADTPLHLAASNERVGAKVVRELLNNGVDPHALNEDNKTAYEMIPNYGTEVGSEKATMLKEAMSIRKKTHYVKSRKPSKEFHEMCNALIQANKNKNRAFLNSIITQGDKFKALSRNHRSLLHFAAECGLVNVVSMLIDASKDMCTKVRLEERTLWERTALHNACIGGWNKVVVILVEGGANIRAADKNFDTALHFAARNKHISPHVIKILLTHGSNSLAVNTENKTALDRIIKPEEQLEKVEILREAMLEAEGKKTAIGETASQYMEIDKTNYQQMQEE